jgi:outer membrane protein TolC
MKKYLLFLFMIAPMFGWSQSEISLDSCINWAYDHFEYESQAMAYRESAELADKNASKNWYPKFVLDANATYQNENIELALPPIPGFESPQVPLNFNRVLVNFSQAIYDGSFTANQKKLEQSKYSILEQKVETEKIKVKAKVTGNYMSILLTLDNMSILASKRKVVAERLKVIQSASEFGSVTPVTIKSLEAEILKIDQQIIEVEYTHKTLYITLSEITGKEIPESTELIKPQPLISYDNNVENRPEIKLLDMQIKNFELQKGMMQTSRNVRINAFGNIGGGYPGYNIFKDEVAPMAMIGVKLQWNIVDYGKVKNDKQILFLNQNIALSEQNRARTQFVTELKTQQQEVKKMQDLLKKDDQMIALRTEITKIKTAELDNGTITSTDYITELNQEEEAKLNQKLHELKLILAELNYLTIQGR